MDRELLVKIVAMEIEAAEDEAFKSGAIATQLNPEDAARRVVELLEHFDLLQKVTTKTQPKAEVATKPLPHEEPSVLLKAESLLGRDGVSIYRNRFGRHYEHQVESCFLHWQQRNRNNLQQSPFVTTLNRWWTNWSRDAVPEVSEEAIKRELAEVFAHDE